MQVTSQNNLRKCLQFQAKANIIKKKGGDIMSKYRVYGNYIFSKVLGEYEDYSEEEAIEKEIYKRK